MRNYTTYVGMDVHSRSIDARALIKETGEERHRVFTNCPTASDVAEWLSTLPQPAYCAYESGCCGYKLARDLRELGFCCDVIAVSTLPKSSKDKQQKCDKLDAKAIMREITNVASDYTTVWIPDEQTESFRCLMRAYQMAKEDSKQAKQRMLSFLLLHGYVWNEKTKTGNPKKRWTKEFYGWLNGLSFCDELAKYTFESYMRRIQDADLEVSELKKRIDKLSCQPQIKPYIDAFCCMKGINVDAAMLMLVEFGDFERFSSGRRVSCWAGMIPKNNSSGDKNRHGKSTKAGNKYIRRSMIEGLAGVATWKSGRKAIPKDAVISASVREIVTKANKRLYERYTHLHDDNHLQANKARVAIANEMIRWMWVIGLQVQKEVGPLCA